VRLRGLIDEVIGALDAATGAARIVNEVPPAVTVRGDADQLHRLFLNLAKNAIEAMPDGGQLTFRSRWSDGFAAIDVSDTGAGLPETVKAHLFEPFAASTGGTGLGLAICREIARAHGGELRLLATGSQGTTFSLELPAATGRAAA
jgi:signal transduction histidine kinase